MPERISGGPKGPNCFYKIQGITCLFHCIDVCFYGAEAIVTQQESGQWHQTILVVTVFFTAMHLHLTKMPISLKNVLDDVVKIINFIKSQPLLSTHLFSYSVTMLEV